MHGIDKENQPRFKKTAWPSFLQIQQTKCGSWGQKFDVVNINLLYNQFHNKWISFYDKNACHGQTTFQLP